MTVMWYICTRLPMNNFTHSFVSSFVCLSFVYSFIHLFSIVLFLRQMTHLDGRPDVIFIHIEYRMYFIILRDFVYFCRFFSLSGIFVCFKTISAAPAHFNEHSHYTCCHAYTPSLLSLSPRKRIKAPYPVGNQISTLNRISMGFCLRNHLFTFKWIAAYIRFVLINILSVKRKIWPMKLWHLFRKSV